MRLDGWSRRRTVLGVALVGVALMVAGVGAGTRLRRAVDPAAVEAVVLPAGVVLRDGDVILAGGVSLRSRAVLAMTGGQQYSHVGLVRVTEGGVFVVHAAPEGAGDGGVGGRVARLPLGTFLAERGYVTVTVLRLTPGAGRDRAACDAMASAAMASADALAAAGVPFDARYDLASADALYCSELVWRVYGDAGLRWPDSIFTEASLTPAEGPAILPGAFLDVSGFDTIWHYPN